MGYRPKIIETIIIVIIIIRQSRIILRRKALRIIKDITIFCLPELSHSYKRNVILPRSDFMTCSNFYKLQKSNTNF